MIRKNENPSYYRARYYDPQAGRFLSEDPIHFWAGANFYAYLRDRSTGFRDPSGNFAVGAVVGAVIGGLEGGMGARLQGGSAGQIAAAVVAGALVGGFVGTLDPTEGAFTATQLGLIGGGAGILGDIIGQSAGQIGRRCKSFNLGEALGAGVGGMAAGYMGAVTAIGVATAGGGGLAQALMGGAIGAAPATLGGPIGAALGNEVTGPVEN